MIKVLLFFYKKVILGTVKEFIEAYSGETALCYSLNRWFRNCNENEYEKIKYFAGPFRYVYINMHIIIISIELINPNIFIEK